MFKNAKGLDKEQHRKLTYTPVPGFQFVSQLPVSILGVTEMVQASKYFPIVFWDNSGDKKLPAIPQAVLSIVENKNAFVADDGSWKVDYVPKHIRRYPFVLGRLPEDNRFAVMIDEAAPQFAGEAGTPMFTEAGEPAELVQKAIKFLEDYKREMDRTQKMVETLEEQDLLKPMTFKITKGKVGRQVKGFRIVDYQKLKALDEKILSQWVNNGTLGMIYAHLFSLQNFAAIAKLQGIEATLPDAE